MSCSFSRADHSSSLITHSYISNVVALNNIIAADVSDSVARHIQLIRAILVVGAIFVFYNNARAAILYLQGEFADFPFELNDCLGCRILENNITFTCIT